MTMLKLLILACITTTLSQPILAKEYKLIMKENAIALYERWIQHNSNEVRELKAVFYVQDCKAEDVVQLLKNQSLGLKWNSNASQYKVYPSAANNSWVAYIRYDLPWPMDDQDCCLLYRYENDADLKKVDISFISNPQGQCPIGNNVSRITGTKGKWLIEYQSNKDLKITYTIATDRNSSIPRMISDPIIHKNMLKTIAQFKDILEKA